MIKEKAKRICISLFIATITSCNYFQERSLPTVTKLDPPERHKVEKVAILPFINQTEVVTADHFLRLAFYSSITTKGYDVIRLENIDYLLEMADIDISNIESIDPYKLGKILKADAIIYGTVSRCSKVFVGVYSKISIGAKMKMIDVSTSRTIWEAEHVEATHGGSPLISPFTIPAEMVDSVLNMRDKVLQDTADRLAKKFIASIPENPFEIAPRTRIVWINDSNSNRGVEYSVQPGDTLYSIANKFYGNGQRWPEIKAANEGCSESSLKVGQGLVIPDIPVIDNLHELPSLTNSFAKKVAYKVKWEDSLYGIASALYHDGKKWDIIYENNKEALTSVTDLPVGQVLILPLEAK